MKRRYRVVLTADGHVRLMERAADSPARWNLQFEENGPQIAVRDRITPQDDVPFHAGLEIQVELDHETLDGAADEAVEHAESALILLSAAGRAPNRSVELQLAYEVTSGVDERAFAQWFNDVPLHLGKAVVPREVFGALFAKIPELPEELATRLVLSMSWHRIGVEHVGVITRYVMLWIACEALSPRLAEHYGVDPRSFAGLRALAVDAGEDERLVSDALGLRRQLLHALRVKRVELEAEASRLVPRLEQLLVAGWVRLLELEGQASAFPTAAVTPNPVRLVFRATLLHSDETTWGMDSHPHFDGQVAQRRVDHEDPRSVHTEFTPTLTLRNADGARPLRLEIRGPQGPHIPTLDPPPPPLAGHGQ